MKGKGSDVVQELFRQILMVSLYSSALALLLLIVRFLIGNKINRVAITLLWGLFLLRLILPFQIASPVSVMNLMPPAVSQNALLAQTTDSLPEALQPAANTISTAALQNDLSEPPLGTADSVVNHIEESGAAANPVGPDLWDIASIVWLWGTACLLALTILANIGFLRKLKKKQRYTEVGFLMLLEQCRRELKIWRSIEAVRLDEIGTAGVCGIFRPRVLICPEAFERLDAEAQRHILLHELMHVKRMDTSLALFIVLLKAFYWFNPLVWVLFALMQSDIEILCDAAVIKELGQGEHMDYAETLLNIAEYASKRKRMRLVMAVADKPSQIKRRIIKAMEWKKHRPLYTLAAVLLVLIAAVAGCTAPMPQVSVISNLPPQTAQAKDAQESASQNAASLQPESLKAEAQILKANPSNVKTALIADYSITEKNATTNRIYNIKKAMQLLNGQVIEPGKILSMNTLLGERSEQNSWKTAPGIISGVYTDQWGGGVCSVSMLLYGASLYADLEIVDNTHHALPKENVPPGLDATITSGRPDLVIKNNKNSDITIKTGISQKITMWN